MMVTEEQAKEKWCPKARAPVGNAASNCAVNRTHMAHHGLPACIGSQCMAWRWTPVSEVLEKRSGYCGAFGKP